MWRPKGWNAIEVAKTVQGRMFSGVSQLDVELIEAGADAMHDADVRWIKEHILQTEGVFTKEDWENWE